MKVGDWVIINKYGLKIAEIKKLTDARLYYQCGYFGPRYIRLGDSSIAFTGTKKICEQVLDQLKCCRAQRDKGEQEVNLRYQKQWEEIVHSAVSKQNVKAPP